jgi:DNA-directed RNA polymerase I, II, and III subunit RPABC5
MPIPIRCFTCGAVIADKYHYYQMQVRKRNMESKNIQRVQYLTVKNSEKAIEGQVLDDLEMTRACCRRHFLTQPHID